MSPMLNHKYPFENSTCKQKKIPDMKTTTFAVCLFLIANLLQAQQLPDFKPLSCKMEPLELGQFVADNIIDQTEFVLEYGIMEPSPDIEFIDFGKSLDNANPGVAYALSTLYSESDQNAVIGIASTSGTKVWINDQLVFSRSGDAELSVQVDEQSYILPEHFSIDLNKGENKILVKSAYSGNGKWQLFINGVNMGKNAEKGKKIIASLDKYAPKVDLTNWLILGCFDNHDGNGLNYQYEPESNIEMYKMYTSGNNTFTWDIPRIHIITKSPTGGKFYRWVYHVGGFMWGLQSLSQETNTSKYYDFTSNWCDFILETLPLVKYQMHELHASRSINWRMSMLDYTSAPSLPFVARLNLEDSFQGRDQYKKYVDSIIDYLQNDQYRLPSGLFCRNYLTYPTVWADDMFMGPPFLLLSAEYTEDKNLRKELYDDAANQIIQCNKLLFNKEKQLYRQACYIGHPEYKVPYWSRGNGWAIWGTSEVLLRLPKDHKDYQKILKIFRNHIDGIVRAQDKDGYYHNILDMPETVRESSGNAIFTLCIARGINNGWLDREKYSQALEKGWSALNTFIGQDGNLYGVKGGTNFSTDPKDYERIPFLKSDTHGTFPLLFACIEMDHYYKSK